MFVAVSGGHHASSAVALDQKSLKVIARAVGEGLNLHLLSWREVAKEFNSLMEKLRRDLDGEVVSRGDFVASINRIVVAFPGAATDADRLVAQGAVRLHEPHYGAICQIVDDTWAGLVAGALDSVGVCAFSGTGASVFVGGGTFSLDRSGKYDGWGPVMGDRGSGYWIASEFLRCAAQEHEKGRRVPLLQDIAASEGIELAHPGGLQPWIDEFGCPAGSPWPALVARLAVHIGAAADRSDPSPEAIRIIERAAHEIAKTIRVAIDDNRNLFNGCDVPVILQGGVFVNCRFFRELVKNLIGEFFRGPVGVARYRPVMGAAVFCIPDAPVEKVSRSDIREAARRVAKSISGYSGPLSLENECDMIYQPKDRIS